MKDDQNFESLIARFQQGDRRALSRLITLVARGDHIDAIRAALNTDTTTIRHSPLAIRHSTLDSQPSTFDAPVIAFTGSGGVGKSTLIGRLIDALRNNEQSVAVLACDPQSPLTGGALLGDRIRMPSRPDDRGVFIRSFAVPSGGQAVATHLEVVVQLLARFGFQYVFVETVGAGQGDTAIRGVADVVVLLVQPEAGDDLQWEKAGVLEIADIVVVNKADLPGAERTEAQLREILNLPGCREVPVLRASGGKNHGVAELWSAIGAAIKRGG